MGSRLNFFIPLNHSILKDIIYMIQCQKDTKCGEIPYHRGVF